MQALLVLPTYNEAANLKGLVTEIRVCVPQLDILVVDDNSPDGTGKIADRFASEDSKFRVIHRPRKSGRGGATAAGFKYAIGKGYDYVLEMDVDGSHSPSDLPRLLEAAGSVDLVIASRFLEGGGVEGLNWVRRFVHLMADFSVKLMLGTPNTDHTNGFRCYRVAKLKKIDLGKFSGNGYIGQTLLENIFYKLGFSIKEIPSLFRHRRCGRSKMGFSEMVHGISAMLRMRWTYRRHGVRFYLNDFL